MAYTSNGSSGESGPIKRGSSLSLGQSWTWPDKAQLGPEQLEARWLNLHSAIVRAGRLVLVRVSAIRTGAVIGTWSNLVLISVHKERD